jgi:hypothetical protein
MENYLRIVENSLRIVENSLRIGSETYLEALTVPLLRQQSKLYLQPPTCGIISVIQ